MSNLVGNLEDRFSHVVAHYYSENKCNEGLTFESHLDKLVLFDFKEFL